MQFLKAAAISIGVLHLVSSAVAEGRLTVTGEGSVETTPDMATISLGVTTGAKTAAEALSANNEATAAVLERVSAAQIEPRDVQTSGLSLSPRWEQNRDEGSAAIVGYVASNQVTVRVRDLAMLGEVLDDVVSSGANMFNGPVFGLQDPQPAMDEARRQAVADALRKAALYADAAGIGLGPVAEISEMGGNRPQPMFRREAAMMDSAVPVSEGAISIAASVNVVFDIAE